MELLLAGKTALVTGASSGIGRGIAYALVAEGVRLAITARRRERLEEVAATIVARGGHPPVVIEQDFMSEDAPHRIAERALAGLDSVQILVNNAGGSRAFKLQASEAQWHEAMTLNFTRQRQLADLLVDPMIARKWGRIINITGKSEPEGINGAFLNMAIASGLTSAITNPVSEGVRTAVMASDVLMGNDRDAARWIRQFRVEPADGESGRRRVNRRRGPAGNGTAQERSADVPGVDVPGVDVPAAG